MKRSDPFRSICPDSTEVICPMAPRQSGSLYSGENRERTLSFRGQVHVGGHVEAGQAFVDDLLIPVAISFLGAEKLSPKRCLFAGQAAHQTQNFLAHRLLPLNSL